MPEFFRTFLGIFCFVSAVALIRRSIASPDKTEIATWSRIFSVSLFLTIAYLILL